MKKCRFFWGFLKSQEKWLNKMSEKGYRLTGTTISGYEFDECEPGKYVYTVEYIGNKSYKDGAAYKEFLEELGYSVFYKNINLDFSFGKVEFRPFADKGGRVATDKGAHNKEILLVEKENDGKPFELHTTASDQIAYYRDLIKPSLFFAIPVIILGVLLKNLILLAIGVLLAIPVIINAINIIKLKKASSLDENGSSNSGFSRGYIIAVVIAAALAIALGCFLEPLDFATNINSGTRLGFIGNDGAHKMSGRYAMMSGSKQHAINIDDGSLDVTVVTKSGTMIVRVVDETGNVLLEETLTNTESGTEKEFKKSVPFEGKARISIETKKHSGSYLFE